MATTIEVKYFNSFLLKKQSRDNTSSIIGGPVWNGSFGIPQAIGGFQQQDTDPQQGWYIEL